MRKNSRRFSLPAISSVWWRTRSRCVALSTTLSLMDWNAAGSLDALRTHPAELPDSLQRHFPDGQEGGKEQRHKLRTSAHGCSDSARPTQPSPAHGADQA
ncbi:unnamed protein product [Prorocentrum cordatum]|uniref:Uncharacterized protein n=1 Tax=Prorocentrum cordatum TaxID=2364126 RepID=A0ABN9RHB2_9DINO|nr:unnamed protein product [Polarella glacialis]